MIGFVDSLQVGVILLREAFEAVLILVTVTALLQRVAPGHLGMLWGGAGLGLLVSVLAAGLYHTQPSGVGAPWVEGVTCLLAAGLMLYVGGWLWRQADPLAWNGTLERAARRALFIRRMPLALGLLGFVAVFREGLESVLFLAALGPGTEPGALLVGSLLALLVLLALLQAGRLSNLRVPLRPLFQATSVVLLVSAAQLAHAGLLHFQSDPLP